MNNTKSTPTISRARLLAAVASGALAGAVGISSLTAGTASVQADPVRVEAPQQVPSFADVVEKISPAVVSVRVKSTMQPASDGSGFSFGPPGLDNLPDNHPFKRFFREFGPDRFEQRSQRRGRNFERRQRPISQGSGFFISDDGYLVTNNHVIQGGSSYTVVMDDGTEIDAELVGADPRTDLAVLKVEEERKFTYVAFAQEDDTRVGDWVVAVGNPFGLGGTVTAGIISARGRDIGAGPYDDFIQIDAAVNRGNSGGPALNLKGEVVGINTAIFSPSGGNVGIAFAIPSSTAKGVVADLITTGSVQRGWLGVQIQPVTQDIADSLDLESTSGALVSSPQPGGPAEKAGIRSGDVITKVDDQPVASPKELARLIGNLDPETTVGLTVWRDGSSQVVEVELGEMTNDEQQAGLDSSQPDEDEMMSRFGLTIAPADSGEGVVVTDVEAGSDAQERGLEAGDVIVKVHSMEVRSVKDVEDALKAAAEDGRKAVLIQVERDETSRFVALPVSRG